MSFSIAAQEAGKAGELLKNEAKTGELQTQRNDGFRGSNDKILENSSNGKSPTFRAPKSAGTNNYRWNYNAGKSEVFLRIPEKGNYSVEIGDQFMSNSTGKFRFFELRAGTVPISIYENNYLIYRTRLNVRNNTRLVLDFFNDFGLYLLGNYPVQNQSYGINEWDDVWNNPYGNQNGNWNGNGGNQNYYANVMSDQEFAEFLIAFDKNTSFDSDKVNMIRSVARNTNFTSKQIYALAKTFSFDKGRLEMAKIVYSNCVDRRNFYKIMETFTFESSKRELSDFVGGFN